jgi:hypothetical protein
MLTGKVKLELYAPTLDDLLARPVTARISQSHIEFNDVSFTDLNGDPFEVVPAQIDIKGSHVTYKIISKTSGDFFNTNDTDGFNGYVMTFAALGGKHGTTLRSAHLVARDTTLDIDKSDVQVSKTALYVNVDGLHFDPKDKIDIALSFRQHGNRQHDTLSGLNGDDLLIGNRGSDTLTGHAGADTFEFAAGASSGRITDFDAAEGDRIDLSHLYSGHDRASVGHAGFIGDTHFPPMAVPNCGCIMRVATSMSFPPTPTATARPM